MPKSPLKPRSDTLSQTNVDIEQVPQDMQYMDYQLHLAETQLSLSDYLTAVKMVMDDRFDHEVWVQAEIQAINSKGGHYYLELAEKDDDGGIVASCRATLWRYKAQTVLQNFSRTSGQTLAPGMSVLIRCSASFHAQYGFSLNISNIDPAYTLGKLAAAYNAMKQRLIHEGLFNLNKNRPSPFDIRQVAVIAPEKAAGLGDFRTEADRLSATQACQFHYYHATFQGNQAADEILHALASALINHQDKYNTYPDLLVIIRGGGAVGDLAYLNNYELAALVAECPVPVWVGIGHERDQVILDEVAHTSFDTPSKVIFGIESHLVQMVNKAKAAMSSIQHDANLSLNRAKKDCQQQIDTIKTGSRHKLVLAKKDSRHQLLHLQTSARHQSQQQKHLLDRSLDIHKQVFYRLSLIKNECRHLQGLILVQHPQKTLAKGYAIIHDQQGQTIKSSKQLYPNQKISLTLQDGKHQALIIS